MLECVLKPRRSQKHCWVTAEATLKALNKLKYTGNEFSLKSGLEAVPAQQEGCNLHVQMLPAVEVVSYTSKEKNFATPGTIKECTVFKYCTVYSDSM